VTKYLIHSNAPWTPSGYGKQARHAGAILKSLGHQVSYSAFQGLGGSPITYDGDAVYPMGVLPFSPDAIVPNALAAEADVIVSIMDTYMLAPAARHLRNCGIPFAPLVVTDCEAENGGPSIADQEFLVAAGALPAAVSKFGQARLQSIVRDERDEWDIPYVPHAVDTGIFRPPADRAAARAEHGTTGNFVIGICGANNDQRRKGYQEQFAAFQRFSRRHPDARLAIMSVTDSPRGINLRQIAYDLGIIDQCIWMPSYEQVAGILGDDFMAAWYGSLDILSMCSHAEGFGLPLVEAQACGTPVVATHGSAMTELAEHAGWLVHSRRYWNEVHRAWWARPDEDSIIRQWERAYQARTTDATGWGERQAAAVDFARRYSLNQARKHWEAFTRDIADHHDLSAGTGIVESGGLKWHYDDSFRFGDRLAIDGHEDGLEDLVFRGLPEGGTFVDVGAHVGRYALRAAEHYKARVIAIEANPGTARQLSENVHLNDLENSVKILNYAAWDKTETLTLYSQHGHDHDGTDNVIGKGEPAGTVEAYRLDELLDNLSHVDVVKIDTEGADLHVLRGLSGLLVKHRPRLFVEDHSVYGMYAREDLNATLEQLGYRWHDVAPGYVEAVPSA